MIFLISAVGYSQNHYLNQVIIGSGGNFSNPDDFVTIAAFNPDSDITTVFDTIYTQSIQDIYIKDEFAWVAAQDSIVKYNLNNYQRVAAIEAPAVNKLNVTGNILIASFWYPATSGFVKTYSAENLSELFVYDVVPDEAAGIHIMQEEKMATVAVPGGWMSTEGRINWIDLETNTVMETNFGAQGIGINHILKYEYPVPNYGALTVTPWGESTFYFLTFDAVGNQTGNYLFEGVMGGYTGKLFNNVYLKLNDGIGTLDLISMEISNDLLIEPTELAFSGTFFDTINKRFYIASTDYSSTGEGVIYDINGQQVGLFDAGISTEVIVGDYRSNTFISKPVSTNIKIYPNPVYDVLNISTDISNKTNATITDLSGRVIITSELNKSSVNIINLVGLDHGVYLLQIQGQNTRKFIKY